MEPLASLGGLASLGISRLEASENGTPSGERAWARVKKMAFARINSDSLKQTTLFSIITIIIVIGHRGDGFGPKTQVTYISFTAIYMYRILLRIYITYIYKVFNKSCNVFEHFSGIGMHILLVLNCSLSFLSHCSITYVTSLIICDTIPGCRIFGSLLDGTINPSSKCAG